MDRQDLKEGQEVYVKGRVIHTGDHLDIVLDKGSFIENAIVLHYEKPVLPQFVADWIDVCKENLAIGLYTAMNPDFLKQYNKSNELIAWVRKHKNQETFARAWLDGYEVEKKKRYLVKVKGVHFTNYLISGNQKDIWFFHSAYEPEYHRIAHTRKELEEAGFGEVFDSPLFEVEEVN